MASNNSNAPDGDDYIDITHLMQRCAAESLSYSHPFTPLVVPCSLPITSGNDKNAEEEEDDDAALEIQGSSLHITYGDDHAGDGNPNIGGDKNSPYLLTPIDMRDAMTALELGDERMDCCEIPIITSVDLSAPSSSSQRTRTIPPRIAPLHLSDGTTSSSAAPHPIIPTQPNSSDIIISPSAPLQLPSSPCPSLLPYWKTLSISSTSSSHQLLPLLLLQLTSLEAYIGTNNGGSNAAETLYCMLWCHDGVLADMRDTLSTSKELDEVSVAQWTLFASSIGVVRIAEVVRWAVVNADIYEEEDFGVALHGGVDDTSNVSDDNDSSSSSTMRFCPSLKQENSATMSSVPTYQADEYIEQVWDTALKRLRDYSSSLRDTDRHERDTIHALEIILRLQQSFYSSICRLSELNDQNVTDFTTQAKDRSRETVTLLNKLSTCKAVASSSAASSGLVETDGRLRSLGDERLDSLLHTSFDPFVNRRLLGNAPVRKARFCNTFKVIKSLSRVVSELEWAVCDVILEGNTLGISELNDQNVTDFTTQAKDRSRETVTLLNKLSTCKAVASSSAASSGLVETDGRLRSLGDERLDSLLHTSFDPFVNRRLLGNAPVRKARFCNTFKVIKSLSRVVSELEWAVCDVILEGNTLGRVMRMLENNSSRGVGGAFPTTTKSGNDDNDDEPPFGNNGLAIENPVGINILSRSLMLLNLYFDDKLLGQYDFPIIIGE